MQVLTEINNPTFRPRKKETLIYRWTDLPSKVGRSFFFFLTLVLLRGVVPTPPNGSRPGAQNRTAKG